MYAIRSYYVNKINPSVFDGQFFWFFLGFRLIQKYKITAVIKLPGQTLFRKNRIICKRRSGTILSKSCRINNQRAGFKPGNNRIIILQLRAQIEFRITSYNVCYTKLLRAAWNRRHYYHHISVGKLPAHLFRILVPAVTVQQGHHALGGSYNFV